MTGFQKLCLITIALVVLLIAVGGIVRATDSGLGCPDWPTCHGKLIPEWEKHTLIEYSHRLTASVVGFAVLGIIVQAWRQYRHVPAILYPSVLAGVLVLVLAGLGAAAVVNDLPSEIVMLHLGLALIILGLLTVIATASFALDRPLNVPALPSRFRNLAAAGIVLVFLTVLIGGYASGAGYGLACSGWPLCNGDVMPSTESTSVQTIFGHRVLAFVLGLVLAGLAFMAFKLRRDAPVESRLAIAAFHIYVLQALVGAANVWTDLSDTIDAIHLAIAAMLWLTLALLNVRLLGLHELLPLRTPAAPAGLAGQAR